MGKIAKAERGLLALRRRFFLQSKSISGSSPFFWGRGRLKSRVRVRVGVEPSGDLGEAKDRLKPRLQHGSAGTARTRIVAHEIGGTNVVLAWQGSSRMSGQVGLGQSLVRAPVYRSQQGARDFRL